MYESIELIRKRLEALAAETSWGRVAAELAVPKVTLWRFCLRGYEPRTPRIRLALGLAATPGPIVLAEARLCACQCGTWFIPRVWNQRRIPGHPRRRRQEEAVCPINRT